MEENEALTHEFTYGWDVFGSEDAKEGPDGLQGEAHAELHRDVTQVDRRLRPKQRRHDDRANDRMGA